MGFDLKKLVQDNKAEIDTFKLLFIGIVCFFILSFTINFIAGATVDIENLVESYNPDTRTFTLEYENGTFISSVKLITPLYNHVGFGEEILVAEYLVNASQPWEDMFGEVELYKGNLQGIPISKNIKYKYEHAYTEEVDVYETQCNEITHGNSSVENICEEVFIETIDEIFYKWKAFNKNTELNPGITKIGLFTEVERNEVVEFVPNFLDTIRAIQWATWDSSLSDSLVAYWKFNETSYPFSDSIGIFNITPTGGSLYTTEGKIGGGMGVMDDTNWADTGVPLAGDSSIAFWINRTGGMTPAYIGTTYQTATENGAFGFGVGGGGADLDVYVIDGGGNALLYETFLAEDRWYFVALTFNVTSATWYVDGQQVAVDPLNSRSQTYGATFHINSDIAGGYPSSNFIIDEMGIWNRTLTPSEIQTLNESITYSAEQPDTTSPTLSITYPTNITYNFSLLGFNFTVGDETALSSCWYNTDGTNNTIECGNNASGLTALQGSNTWYVWANDTAGNNATDNVIFYVDSIAPTVTNINWETTGGLIDNALGYNQIINFVNASCNDTNILSCNITVLDPDGNVVIDNIAMTNESAINYTYTDDFTFNLVGTWVINVNATDTIGNKGTASETITITSLNQSLIDGFFGYNTETIPSNATINSLATFDYDLIEVYDYASNVSDNWSIIKTSIERANDLNIKVGLRYMLDWNLTEDVTSRDAFIDDINSNFDDLLSSPYLQTVEYIKLEVNETWDYVDTNITDDNIDLIAKSIFNITENEFIIYSSYNSTTLDTDYSEFESNTLNYVTASDENTLIDELANLTRSVETKTRIYYNISNTLKGVTQDYQNNVMIFLTETINITTSIEHEGVSELLNGDLIIYNNQSTAKNYTYNVSVGLDTVGKDLWDYTQGILLENNSDGNLTFLNVPGYSAIIVGTENIDHISLSEVLTSGTVFQSLTNQIYASNHTDGVREGASAGSNSRGTEIWDGSYLNATSMVYYGFLNVTGIVNPYQFDGLTYLIIADKNDGEIDKLFQDNITIGGVYGYISVADFNVSNSTWVDSKKTNVDQWLAFNESMNIFFDGLDAGAVTDGEAFETAVKNLTDYVKITKSREVGINVFTQYQIFAQLSSSGGFAMKESCTHKWTYSNGVDDTAGYNYSNQFWEDDGTGFGDYNKSIWYNNHNINLICVPFINRTTNYYALDNTNYSLMDKLYFKARVLGYDNIAFSTPTFDIAYYDKQYDVGTKLQSEPTVNSDLYSMRYTKGTAYYNSTSDSAWFDDGLSFENGSIDVILYDDAQHNYTICINDYCDYSITTEADGFSYDTYNIAFNSTVFNDAKGHYTIYINSTDGGFVGDDTNSLATYGKHSYFKSGDIWSIEADTTGNHMVNLNLNLSYTSSIDTTDKITQTETTTDALGQIKNVTFTAIETFKTRIWSYQTTVSGTLASIRLFSAGSYINLNYTDSTACVTANPSFTLNTILGIGNIGVCVDTSSGIDVRFQLPEIDGGEELLFEVSGDTSPPRITIVNPDGINDETTNDVLFVVTTDKQAICNYSTDGGITNITMSGEGTTSHSGLQTLSYNQHTVIITCTGYYSLVSNSTLLTFLVKDVSDEITGGGTTGGEVIITTEDTTTTVVADVVDDQTLREAINQVLKGDLGKEDVSNIIEGITDAEKPIPVILWVIVGLLITIFMIIGGVYWYLIVSAGK